MEELRQAIEDVSDGGHSARKPQRVSEGWAGVGLVETWRTPVVCRSCLQHHCMRPCPAALPLRPPAPHRYPRAIAASAAVLQFGAGASPGGARGEISVSPMDLDSRYQSADYYTHTDETRAFQAEAQEARERQDAQLEHIETGLGALKEIGGAMGEELARHDVLISEVDDKMDKVTKELQTNNMRLKGLVTKVRSGLE